MIKVLHPHGCQIHTEDFAHTATVAPGEEVELPDFFELPARVAGCTIVEDAPAEKPAAPAKKKAPARKSTASAVKEKLAELDHE